RRMPAEGPLIDAAVGIAIKRHAEMLEFVHDSGAVRHMYSIASWSPSQSEPLIVSYMCQSQWSSLMLPSAAPMPPCAATVCDRVGKTFDSTATDSPCWASCSEARMPAPPAPTTMASN